jgi:hypothetical protein
MPLECKNSQGWLRKIQPSHFQSSGVPKDKKKHRTVELFLRSIGTVFNLRAVRMQRRLEYWEATETEIEQHNAIASPVIHEPESEPVKSGNIMESQRSLTAVAGSSLEDCHHICAENSSDEATPRLNTTTAGPAKDVKVPKDSEEILDDKPGISLRHSSIPKSSPWFSENRQLPKAEIRLTTPYGETTLLTLESPTLSTNLSLPSLTCTNARSHKQQELSRTPPRLPARPSKPQQQVEALQKEPPVVPPRPIGYRKKRKSREPRSIQALITEGKARARASSIVPSISPNYQDAVLPSSLQFQEAGDKGDEPPVGAPTIGKSAEPPQPTITTTTTTPITEALSHPSSQVLDGKSLVEQLPTPQPALVTTKPTSQPLQRTQIQNSQLGQRDLINQELAATSHPTDSQNPKSPTTEAAKGNGKEKTQTSFKLEFPKSPNAAADLRGTPEPENTRSLVDPTWELKERRTFSIPSRASAVTDQHPLSPPEKTLLPAPSPISYPPGQLPLPPPLKAPITLSLNQRTRAASLPNASFSFSN